MKSVLNVVLNTTEYRGDHSAEVKRVIDCPADSTIEKLCESLINTDGTIKEYDYITIRIGKTSR